MLNLRIGKHRIELAERHRRVLCNIIKNNIKYKILIASIIFIVIFIYSTVKKNIIPSMKPLPCRIAIFHIVQPFILQNLINTISFTFYNTAEIPISKIYHLNS